MEDMYKLCDEFRQWTNIHISNEQRIWSLFLYIFRKVDVLRPFF